MSRFEQSPSPFAFDLSRSVLRNTSIPSLFSFFFCFSLSLSCLFFYLRDCFLTLYILFLSQILLHCTVVLTFFSFLPSPKSFLLSYPTCLPSPRFVVSVRSCLLLHSSTLLTLFFCWWCQNKWALKRNVIFLQPKAAFEININFNSECIVTMFSIFGSYFFVSSVASWFCRKPRLLLWVDVILAHEYCFFQLLWLDIQSEKTGSPEKQRFPRYFLTHFLHLTRKGIGKPRFSLPLMHFFSGPPR
jgi:hypothetical protein